MTEIRPIVLAEAETFLDLLCEVFALDVSRARSVFYTEPMYDLDRKWALYEDGKMTSILTTTPLCFGWGKAYGIAGVATRPEARGRGLASMLLQEVHEFGKSSGEEAGLLFAKNPAVYEQNGFRRLDEVVRSAFELQDVEPLGEPLEQEAVQEMYAQWCEGDPNRLWRDERRWNYWNWHYRICTPFLDGYTCFEPGVLRECVFSRPQPSLPFPSGTEWVGLKSLAEILSIPIHGVAKFELYLMGRDVRGRPQMFMTDQF